ESGTDGVAGGFTSRVPFGGITLNITSGTVFQIRVRGFSSVNTGSIKLHVNSPCGVTSTTPATGPATGGTSVTITGTGFVNGASVSFGGIAASNVAFVNSTTVSATTPAHAGGPADVVVTNPGGLTDTLASGFTFRPPAP